jgi:hypothetical protein
MLEHDRTRSVGAVSLVLLALGAPGCGDDSEDGDGAGGASGELPACVLECTAPEACAGSEPYNDVDNWACEGGLCRGLGCHGDEECASIGFVCRPNEATGVNGCRQACTAAADCVSPPGELESRDEDNWSCEDGACRYAGCHGDEECVADIGEGAGCREQSDGVAVCLTPCSTPAGCALPDFGLVFDADNWTCDGGFCFYQGCKSDDECTTTFAAQAVCR